MCPTFYNDKIQTISGAHGTFTEMIEDNLCKIKFYHFTKELSHAQSTGYPSRTINLGVHLAQRKWAKFYSSFLSCELMLLTQLKRTANSWWMSHGLFLLGKFSVISFILKNVICTEGRWKKCALFLTKESLLPSTCIASFSP